MKIEVEPSTMIRLMACANATAPQEFSGFGFCELNGEVIRVYDFVLLDIGSTVFTEIPTSELIKLMERPDYANMKVWCHRHPMGSGKPGKDNWSGTDEATIQQTPLGGIPDLVRWSVSMVLTPGGWVGRIDNYLTRKTLHLDVFPQIQPVYAECQAIANAKRQAAKAAADEKAAAIRSRVETLDEQVLNDLGLTREDLVDMACEQVGLYDDLDEYLDEVEDPYGWATDQDGYLVRENTYSFPPREVQPYQRRQGEPHPAFRPL